MGVWGRKPLPLKLRGGMGVIATVGRTPNNSPIPLHLWRDGYETDGVVRGGMGCSMILYCTRISSHH